MGLEAIDSSTRRALDTARLPDPKTGQTASHTPRPASRVEEAAPKPPAGVRVDVAERGVPRRLGVQQQLPPNTRLHLDEATQQIVAQILDENNEVVRQIPPEALLELSARFNRLEGLLFDRTS